MKAYALKHDDNGKFHSIFGSQMQVKMCLGKKPKPIFAIEITEDPDGEYWGWEQPANPGKFVMIWGCKQQLEMCFTYGMKAAIDHGDGRPVQLKVEEQEHED